MFGTGDAADCPVHLDFLLASFHLSILCFDSRLHLAVQRLRGEDARGGGGHLLPAIRRVQDDHHGVDGATAAAAAATQIASRQ